MQSLTLKDLSTIRDSARKHLEEQGHKLVDSNRALSEGERLAAAYYQATVDFLISLNLDSKPYCPKVLFVEEDSGPEEEDYE